MVYRRVERLLRKEIHLSNAPGGNTALISSFNLDHFKGIQACALLRSRRPANGDHGSLLSLSLTRKRQGTNPLVLEASMRLVSTIQ